VRKRMVYGGQNGKSIRGRDRTPAAATRTATPGGALAPSRRTQQKHADDCAYEEQKPTKDGGSNGSPEEKNCDTKKRKKGQG